MALTGHKAWHAPRNGLDTEFVIARHKNNKEKNILEYVKNPYICKFCDVVIPYKDAKVKRHELKRGAKHTFCSQSCAASYNNTHKTKGIRVSKLERWLSEKMVEIFPDLDVHYNRKDAIASELDIYIPSMRLAVELNGILHYEPIFGETKLKKIQGNDNKKAQSCLDKGIELHVIDTSKHAHFKPSTCKPFLDIILSVIAKKESSPARN